MAIIVDGFVIPTMAGAPRVVKTIELPEGAEVLGVFQPAGDAARLIVRGDPAQPLTERTSSAVRQDVALAAAERVARYVGSSLGIGQPRGSRSIT